MKTQLREDHLTPLINKDNIHRYLPLISVLRQEGHAFRADAYPIFLTLLVETALSDMGTRAGMGRSLHALHLLASFPESDLEPHLERIDEATSKIVASLDFGALKSIFVKHMVAAVNPQTQIMESRLKWGAVEL